MTTSRKCCCSRAGSSSLPGVVLGRSVGAGVSAGVMREAAANNMLHRIAEPTRNLAVGLVCGKFTIANSTIKQKSFGSTCTRLE